LRRRRQEWRVLVAQLEALAARGPDPIDPDTVAAEATELGLSRERSLTSLLIWLLANRFELTEAALVELLGERGSHALWAYAGVLGALI
jgi:hypothetical protein